MITKFKTKSGSSYVVETANNMLYREPNCGHAHLATAFDREWVSFESVSGLEVGRHATFTGGQVDYLQTTEIIELTTE